MDNREKIYRKYLGVSALAEQGVGGEKDNAISLKRKMERQNPWLIRYHYDMLNLQKQREESIRKNSQQSGGGFDWSSVFTAADQIFKTVKDFSDVAYGMQRSRLMADQCVVDYQDDGNQIHLTISIPSDVRHLIQTVMSEPQKDAFMETLMDRVYNGLTDDVYGQ